MIANRESPPLRESGVVPIFNQYILFAKSRPLRLEYGTCRIELPKYRDFFTQPSACGRSYGDMKARGMSFVFEKEPGSVHDEPVLVRTSDWGLVCRSEVLRPVPC